MTTITTTIPDPQGVDHDITLDPDRKIVAIKAFRAITNMGLKDSKEALDKVWETLAGTRTGGLTLALDTLRETARNGGVDNVERLRMEVERLTNINKALNLDMDGMMRVNRDLRDENIRLAQVEAGMTPKRPFLVIGLDGDRFGLDAEGDAYSGGEWLTGKVMLATDNGDGTFRVSTVEKDAEWERDYNIRPNVPAEAVKRFAF